MKTKTGTLHPNQEEFLIQVEKYGYFGAVAYGCDEAIEILEKYLEQPYTLRGGVVEAHLPTPART